MIIKGLVFDLDGTLVDSLAATLEAFNYGIESCGGVRMTSQQLLAHFGPGEGEIFAKILGPEKAALAYEKSREFMVSHLGEVPLHAGILDLLHELQKREMPISIFTGRSRETTQLILDHHRLRDRFVSVTTSDDVSSPKPSPEGLYRVLAAMALKPNEILYIGDAPADLIASRSAGVKGVAALWDHLVNKEFLAPYDPTYWAEKPKDLLEILTSG
jgi:pyrophosphatase PpaX